MKIVLYKRNNLIGTAGGSEKVLCRFANEMTSRGHEVALMTRDYAVGVPFYPLSDKVRICNFPVSCDSSLNLALRALDKLLFMVGGIIPAAAKLTRAYKRAVFMNERLREEKPDILVTAGISDLTDFSYGHRLPVPSVVMIHSEPSVFFRRRGFIKERLYRKTAAEADVVQVLFSEYEKTVRRFGAERTAVIGNAVELSKLSATSTSDKKDYKIVYAARFEKGKQQELLVQAFAKLAQEFPLWRVELWGQSKCKEKNKTEALIRKNHLEERVCICGVCDDLESRLLQADICAFPSRFEGFPLALAEAMAAGLPCVGLCSASGVNLLIENEKNGLLTGSSVGEFASGLRLLMSDACLRKRLGEEARKTIKNYAPEKIWNRWEDLLKRVVRQKRPLVSVIMPVYNTPEAYLRAAAESLFAQTYDNWELIIADDCSDNDTAGVLESLNNPRIKIIRHDRNQGAAAARNTALSYAKGDFIALLDSDDIAEPRRLQRQLEFLSANSDVDVVGSWFRKIPSAKEVRVPEKDREIAGHLLFLDNVIGNSTVMFRRRLVDEGLIFFKPGCAAEDFGVWLSLAGKVKFANIQDVLVEYRWHSENFSNRQREAQIRSAAELRAEKWLELAGCGDIKPEIVVRYLERKELSTEELNQLAVLCESLCQSRPGAELRFSEIRGYLSQNLKRVLRHASPTYQKRLASSALCRVLNIKPYFILKLRLKSWLRF